MDIETAQKLLADTQRACDQALADARKRAKDPSGGRGHGARSQLMDLEAERDKVREEIEKLKADALSFRKRFQSMLRDQNDILETDLF